VSVVLDSSATLAWVYSDETTEAICEVFARLNERGAWVPALWRLEVANILEMGVRRGRHDAAFRDVTLADLAELPIRLDPETDRQAWGATVRLAERHSLTVYDAAYLELAQRRGLPLATLDTELRRAAIAEGVNLLGKALGQEGLEC
jgi:predicted nucleic acid-binding protein